ncbi:MAG: hypothetical protein MJK04_37250, partial [Psychrosphaera sp.]|nr:hypothetical protein [Psychrosphaera sp.]
MKQFIHLLVCLLFTTFTSHTAYAQLLVAKDSINFAYKYEGDNLPWQSNLNFQQLDCGNSFNDIQNAVTTSDGILTINTEQLPIKCLSYQLTGGPGTDWDVRTDGNYTVEIRLRVLTTAPGTYSGGLKLFDGNSYGNVQLWPTKTKVETTTFLEQENAAQFVTFRIASYSPDMTSENQVLRVYRNGEELTPEALKNSAATADPMFIFGDFIAASSGWHAQIDYIRWDTSGAFAPVPLYIKSSTEFPYKYEGSELPDHASINLGFVKKGTGNNASVSDGILTINTTPNISHYYEIEGGKNTQWNVSDAGNYTVELRVSANAPSSPLFSAGLQMRDSNSSGILQFWDDKTSLGSGSLTNQDNDSFHIYRISSFPLNPLTSA